MIKSKLYEFINDNDPELDWRGETLFIWIHPIDLNEFVDLLGNDYFCERAITAKITEDYVCIDLSEICIINGINPKNILKKE